MFVWDKGSGDEKIDRLDNSVHASKYVDSRREISNHTYYLTVKTIFVDTILLSLYLKKKKRNETR